MYLYMFGMDGENIENFASEMREKGIKGVVAGSFSEKQIEVLAKHNLDLYTCFGSFAKGNFDDSHLAVDFNGNKKLWFGSGCPSDRDIWDLHINEILETSRKNGIKGIFSDGARYASFASPEGRNSFYTCFCQKCIKRAENFGIDLEAARDLYKKGDFHSGLKIMKIFRQTAMNEYFKYLYDSIKKDNEEYIVGAFIFASSLAGFVGQGSVCDVDILAPMLYRRYPYEQGPACLNHEWSAACEMLDIWPENSSTKAVNSAELLKIGFEPDQIYRETAAVKSNKYKLMPIIQIEDERLGESVAAAERAGADGCGFFMYNKEHMDKYYKL